MQKTYTTRPNMTKPYPHNIQKYTNQLLSCAKLIAMLRPRYFKTAEVPCWAPVHFRFFHGEEFLSSFSSLSSALWDAVAMGP